MSWWLMGLRRYADFSGRSSRKEYWMFVLFNMIFGIVAIVLDNIIGTAIYGVGYGAVYIIYLLAVMIPGLAVSVRRLHDVGKNGWFILVSLIPIIGSIWLLILMCTDSSTGDNGYGPNPLAALAALENAKYGNTSSDSWTSDQTSYTPNQAKKVQKYCENCGSSMEKGVLFCTSCGIKAMTE